MLDIADKLRNIKMLVMDVDGIMTDSRIMLDSQGQWKRFFSVRDGIGIKRLQSQGFVTAVITGANSDDVRRRVQHLKIDYFFENKSDKMPSFVELQERAGIGASQMSYIGDDLPDIPLLQAAGFAASVPEAVEEVQKECDYITVKNGGYGAVRELCDLILAHAGNNQ